MPNTWEALNKYLSVGQMMCCQLFLVDTRIDMCEKNTFVDTIIEDSTLNVP